MSDAVGATALVDLCTVWATRVPGGRHGCRVGASFRLASSPRGIAARAAWTTGQWIAGVSPGLFGGAVLVNEPIGLNLVLGATAVAAGIWFASTEPRSGRAGGDG